jgi:brother of CDO
MLCMFSLFSLFLLALDPFKLSVHEHHILNITEGNTAVIACELPNGNPRPTPIFYHDYHQIDIEMNSSRQSRFSSHEIVLSQSIEFNLDHYRILPSGNLHIIDVTLSDRGEYQCSAKNSLTQQIVNNSQITVLQVSNKPSTNRERQPLSTIIKPRTASRYIVYALI